MKPKLKVMAFEDGYDIEAILISGGIELTEVEFIQFWDTSKALEHIRDFRPNILLLDFYIPPKNGLEVLLETTKLSNSGEITRPDIIVGMSSAMSKNEAMLSNGADYGILKWDIAKLPIWNH
jgi:response regulator of citrate/malate metabolism